MDVCVDRKCRGPAFGHNTISRKEKTMPFGVILMRSPVLHRAAQKEIPLAHWDAMPESGDGQNTRKEKEKRKKKKRKKLRCLAFDSRRAQGGDILGFPVEDRT